MIQAPLQPHMSLSVPLSLALAILACKALKMPPAHLPRLTPSTTHLSFAKIMSTHFSDLYSSFTLSWGVGWVYCGQDPWCDYLTGLSTCPSCILWWSILCLGLNLWPSLECKLLEAGLCLTSVCLAPTRVPDIHLNEWMNECMYEQMNELSDQT